MDDKDKCTDNKDKCTNKDRAVGEKPAPMPTLKLKGAGRRSIGKTYALHSSLSATSHTWCVCFHSCLSLPRSLPRPILAPSIFILTHFLCRTLDAVFDPDDVMTMEKGEA